MLKTLKNPYILCLCASLVIFTTLTNILEVAIKDKDQVRANYLLFIESYLYSQGLLLVTTNLLGLRALHYLGWARTALITPITSIVSTNFILCLYALYPHYQYHVDLPAWIVAIINSSGYSIQTLTINHLNMGLVVVILVHAVKYCFFDATKEMAYLPLNDKLKAEGKAAVDVFGTRFGKSAYGVLQYILLSTTHATRMHDLLNYMAPFVVLLSITWIIVTYNLLRLYAEYSTDTDERYYAHST